MSFDVARFVEEKVREIKETVGREKAVAACSGGLDSSLAAYIAKIALGENLIPLYIDDGFRRYGEVERVVDLLRSINLEPVVLDRRDFFFAKLRGISDAEQKRITYRDAFYSVISEFAKERNAKFLVQGTIASDVIETVKGIKTQHNVLAQIGIDVEKYGFRLIEPLKDLYKPQVKEVARHLNLPEEIVERMPFPGPGLMIRVVGEVTPERVEIVRRATKIVEDELRDVLAFQKFAVLLPFKTTGVKGGRRAYGYAVVIRAVISEDGLKASSLRIPYSLLKRIVDKILEEVPEVVRVLYDLTDKPPATIEYE